MKQTALPLLGTGDQTGLAPAHAQTTVTADEVGMTEPCERSRYAMRPALPRRLGMGCFLGGLLHEGRRESKREDHMNYDPNLTLCGRMATQTVRLTFGLWKYRTTMEVEVGGNCTGLDVIEGAPGIAYDELEQRACFGSSEPVAVIYMKHMDAPDDVLECADDDLRGERWLQDMLIAAEIISIEPDSA